MGFRHRLALLLAGLLMGLAACGGEAQGRQLDPGAPLPERIADGTVLRVGDPQIEVALKASGLIKELDGVEIEFANLSGGPETLEAFRGDALDVGSVADIPPLFAQWVGTEIRIVAVRESVDPVKHPVYELGIAPGVQVDSLDDLAGKKIAYSPGQAQGALVLRTLQKAGLKQDDVELVEMQSKDDAFVNALASEQVDVAPLGGTLLTSYRSKYGRDGATSIKTGIRDTAWVLYAPVETVQDADKAAALKQYVAIYPKVYDWINAHPDEFAKAYYSEHEGLPLPDAERLVQMNGKFQIPTSWDDAIARHQKTADLLAREQQRDPLDLNTLYDRRYEQVIADASGGA